MSWGELSKERLTLLLGANMDGSDKIEPLIIGKSANPRCFRGSGKIPLPYESNKSAWMTGMIWIKWLKGFNSKMKRLKKKVILFIDNCPDHPVVDNLSHVTVHYLPPQTTSLLQPCDQGIIQCFKRNYRQALLQQYILAIENKEDFKLNVLDAMIYTQIAWEKVVPCTVENCFRHAGFGASRITDNESSEESNVEDSELEDLTRHACLLAGHDFEAIDCESYANIDEAVATSGIIPDEEIVTQVLEGGRIGCGRHTVSTFKCCCM